MKTATIIALSLALTLSGAAAQTPASGAASGSLNERLSGDIRPVHDPVIIRERDVYHLFSTGIGKGAQGIVSARTSRDLVKWEAGTPPLERLPEWVHDASQHRRVVCGVQHSQNLRDFGRYRRFSFTNIAVLIGMIGQ